MDDDVSAHIPFTVRCAEYLDRDAFEASNGRLLAELREHHADQLERILARTQTGIDESFLGFVRTYELLAQLIPLHWAVVDIGCCNALQAWFFRHHRGYYGVDPSVPVSERLVLPNTYHFFYAIEDVELLTGGIVYRDEDVAELTNEPVFAICNYVPSDEANKVIRQRYKNLYSFYPEAP